MGVRYDNKWEIAESLDAVGYADWEEGEGEVGGGKQRLWRERWTAMSAVFNQNPNVAALRRAENR
jgi:hypothetical protein